MRNDSDWRGPIAFILALGLAIALVAGVLSAELTPGSVTPQEGSFFSTLGGAIVGAVATYLGVTHTKHQPNGGNDMQDETTTTETPTAPPETPPGQPFPPGPTPGQPTPVPGQPAEPPPAEPQPSTEPGAPPQQPPDEPGDREV